MNHTISVTASMLQWMPKGRSLPSCYVTHDRHENNIHYGTGTAYDLLYYVCCQADMFPLSSVLSASE